MIHTGFRQNSFATCWSIEPHERFTKVRLSISRKNKETGEFEQDFSGFVMMIGQAHAKAQKLRERDRIRLGEVDVTTTYRKDLGKEFVDYKCFDFTMADEYEVGGARSPSSPPPQNPAEGDNPAEEEQLPF